MSSIHTRLEFSRNENLLLNTFRARISDILASRPDFNENGFLIRWLKARNMNISKAETMIRNHIVFRDQYDIDEIDTPGWKPNKTIHDPFGIFGEDREGRPVQYLRFGKMDLKGIYHSTSAYDLVRYQYYKKVIFMKKLEEQSIKYQRPITNGVLIIDLEGLSYQTHYHPPSISLLNTLIRASEDNYPEYTSSVYILANTSLLSLAYGLVSKFIDEGTKEKIKVFGPTEWNELRKYISPDQLPRCYGGEAVGPDDQCSDFIPLGGIIPEHCYLRNKLEQAENKKQLTIGPRSSISLTPELIETPGRLISYTFRTDNGDIGFGVYYSEHDHNTEPPWDMLEVILPMKRYSTYPLPEERVVTCHKPGYYYTKIDNSYSWMYSKVLHYVIDIQQP